MQDSSRQQKLRALVRRHEECKIAFDDLKSEIRLGLVEAKEVFDSLSVPLTKLVGLKTMEMTGEGRSSSVRIIHEVSVRNGSDADGSSRSPFLDVQHQIPSNDELELSSRAIEACEELREAQNQNIRRLIHLLRTIELHVTSRHDSILQTLDSHRNSLHLFLKKSISFLSALPRSSSTRTSHFDSISIVTIHLTSRILRTVFEHAESTIDAVEKEVESLLECLAEEMCEPMVAHVKRLRAEVERGPTRRIASMVCEVERKAEERGKAVVEMEVALGNAMVEVEKVRKRARLEEEEKAEALRLYKEYEQKFRGMKEIVMRSFSEFQNKKNPSPLSLQGNQLPTAGGDILVSSGSGRRPVTRSCSRGVGLRTPSPVALLPGLITSPSACNRGGAVTRKRKCSDRSSTVSEFRKDNQVTKEINSIFKMYINISKYRWSKLSPELWEMMFDALQAKYGSLDGLSKEDYRSFDFHECHKEEDD